MALYSGIDLHGNNNVTFKRKGTDLFFLLKINLSPLSGRLARSTIAIQGLGQSGFQRMAMDIARHL